MKYKIYADKNVTCWISKLRPNFGKINPQYCSVCGKPIDGYGISLGKYAPSKTHANTWMCFGCGEHIPKIKEAIEKCKNKIMFEKL